MPAMIPFLHQDAFPLRRQNRILVCSSKRRNRAAIWDLLIWPAAASHGPNGALLSFSRRPCLRFRIRARSVVVNLPYGHLAPKSEVPDTAGFAGIMATRPKRVFGQAERVSTGGCDLRTLNPQLE